MPTARASLDEGALAGLLETERAPICSQAHASCLLAPDCDAARACIRDARARMALCSPATDRAFVAAARDLAETAHASGDLELVHGALARLKDVTPRPEILLDFSGFEARFQPASGEARVRRSSYLLALGRSGLAPNWTEGIPGDDAGRSSFLADLFSARAGTAGERARMASEVLPTLLPTHAAEFAAGACSSGISPALAAPLAGGAFARPGISRTDLHGATLEGLGLGDGSDRAAYFGALIAAPAADPRFQEETVSTLEAATASGNYELLGVEGREGLAPLISALRASMTRIGLPVRTKGS